MAEGPDSIAVVSEPELIRILDLSERTFDKMKREGDVPPKTQLSARRVGYRVADVKVWLDARRKSNP